MSDCSTQAMEPRERRTCGTCKNVNAVWFDCFHAENDSSYYMRCTRPDVMACEHYVNDPYSLPLRYERLAQVAREMWRYMDGVLNRNWAYSLPSDTDAFREQLEECGVSVDA